jgi:hypothetical protein
MYNIYILDFEGRMKCIDFTIMIFFSDNTFQV